MVLLGGGNRAESHGVGVGAARKRSVVVLRAVALGLLRCEAERTAAWGLVLGVATARDCVGGLRRTSEIRVRIRVRCCRQVMRPWIGASLRAV